MPRRGITVKRELVPDPVYNNILVTKLINHLMLKGKRSLAEKIVYNALDLIVEKTQQEGIVMLEKAVNNVKPLVAVKPRRVGGATYQVPTEVPYKKGLSLAMKWIVSATRKRSGTQRRAYEKLAGELMDACNNLGGAVKKKEDIHKAAEANRAFAHFRW